MRAVALCLFLAVVAAVVVVGYAMALGVVRVP